MRFGILVAITIMFIGCNTAAKRQERLNAWVGSSIEELIAKWGSPTTKVPLENGTIVYGWIESETNTSHTYNAFTRSVSSDTETSVCKQQAFVDSKGTIKRMTFAGDC